MGHSNSILAEVGLHAADPVSSVFRLGLRDLCISWKPTESKNVHALVTVSFQSHYVGVVS